jgi:hypothetical protein
MEFPKDLGQRIVEATRLAVMLHMQHELRSQSIPGGTGRKTGRAFLPIDGVDLRGGASASRGGASISESEVA